MCFETPNTGNDKISGYLVWNILRKIKLISNLNRLQFTAQIIEKRSIAYLLRKLKARYKGTRESA